MISIVRNIKAKLCTFQRRQVLILIRPLGKETTQTMGAQTIVLRDKCGPPLFFFISWRLITLQYCSGFCHTLTRISPGFTCIPHPDPPSHLPLHLIPLGLPSAPGPSTCLMHPTWAMLIHLGIVCGNFHAMTAELNSYDRDHMAHKAWDFISCLLEKDIWDWLEIILTRAL